MAFTQSNLTRNVTGNCRTYSGSFTSVSGDSTLSVTHGMIYIAEQHVQLTSSLNAANPQIVNSGGTATVVWDDTLGASGQFYFIGR